MKRNSTICIAASLMLAACGFTKLATSSVGYQSVRTVHAQPTKTSPIPDEAKIAAAFHINQTGALTAIVYNRTSKIMTIDQTKSFFVDSDGKSTSYYDPTVKTTSVTDMSSSNGLATSTCQNDAFQMRSKAFNEIFPTKCFGI